MQIPIVAWLLLHVYLTKMIRMGISCTQRRKSMSIYWCYKTKYKITQSEFLSDILFMLYSNFCLCYTRLWRASFSWFIYSRFIFVFTFGSIRARAIFARCATTYSWGNISISSEAKLKAEYSDVVERGALHQRLANNIYNYIYFFIILKKEFNGHLN